MAFTARQKADIRKYLGSASVYLDMQHRLEGALDVVGNNAEASADVIVWLTRLADLDDKLFISAGSTLAVAYGTLKKVDEVEFHPITKESSIATIANVGMQDQGRALVARIARSLGVWDFLPSGDYFAASGPRRSNELSLG